MEKSSHFRQLEAWQEAHKLVLMVYQATKVFLNEERFGLVAQMRRAAISIPANIAEGFKRRGIRDKIRFYNVSEGSLEEIKYFLILSLDLGHTVSCDKLMAQSEAVGRLLNGLIVSIERSR
jgi:four helix bundle protein